MAKTKTPYFSRLELSLWLGSVAAIVLAFLLFDRGQHLTLLASLIGVTALIFCAKGNPLGQIFIIIFCLLYGLISYTFGYYGEMATYLGMSMPMACFALISWLRHPHKGNRAQVEVGRLVPREWATLLALTALVTLLFYHILAYFHTANLIPSTLSVATSFAAVCLTCKRSPYFALWYAANDLVLIVLWLLAARVDTSYLSVVVCFLAFLLNDIYGYVNWRKMERQQVTPPTKIDAM